MPRYSVEVTRTTLHKATISITARDEDDAAQKVLDEHASVKKALSSAEWDLESEDYEATNVDEEDGA